MTRIVNMAVMTRVADKSPVRSYGGVSARQRVAARYERLLDAALELYGTRGYVATGVKDVCRQAGLTDRYFYESFQNSGDLFTAAFDRTTNELLLLVAQRLTEVDADPAAQVRAAIETFVRALADGGNSPNWWRQQHGPTSQRTCPNSCSTWGRCRSWGRWRSSWSNGRTASSTCRSTSSSTTSWSCSSWPLGRRHHLQFR
ncbi:MAG: TetR/AcrR family transcriptional regulator [Actinobacteria bacterium]|nr:MAG: TetR/AcrR family transcriptional regulator [Actinomycetota bacterium]